MGNRLTIHQTVASKFLCDTATSFFIAPVETYSTLLQVGMLPNDQSFIEGIVNIYLNHGLSYFYKGTILKILFNIPRSVVSCVTAALYRITIAQYFPNYTNSDYMTYTFNIMNSTVVRGMLHPIYFLKNEILFRNSNSLWCSLYTFKKAGVIGFYPGLECFLLGSFVSGIVSLLLQTYLPSFGSIESDHNTNQNDDDEDDLVAEIEIDIPALLPQNDNEINQNILQQLDEVENQNENNLEENVFIPFSLYAFFLF